MTATTIPTGTLMNNHKRAVGTAIITPIIIAIAASMPPIPPPTGIRLESGPQDRGWSRCCILTIAPNQCFPEYSK
jgi:hypothetical protein